MAQRARHDEPFAFHHVYNRGVAKRTLFERRSDCRYFLACLARAVRGGSLEIHAYCLLTTHFHLLVRSPTGSMWRGMRRVQNAYARRFNRERRRDGPLFRGRFRSKRVQSDAYMHTLIRYIDGNAVSAGLVSDASAYPWGSARFYRCGGRPKWLSHGEVATRVMRARGSTSYCSQDYESVFGARLTPEQEALVDRRLLARDGQDDPLVDLLDGADGRAIEWMRRKTALADGTQPGLPVAHSRTVVAVVTERAHGLDAIRTAPGARSRDPADLLAVGLLRSLASLSLMEIAALLRMTRSTARGLLDSHRLALRCRPDYVALAAACVTESVHRDWDVPGR